MRSSWNMLKLRTGLALTALGLSLGALAACTVTNENHCALNQGVCGDGMACSMCAIDNNGCVPAASPLEDACLFAGGGTLEPTTGFATTTTTPSTPTTFETSTSTPTTSETTDVDPTTTITTGPVTSATSSTTDESTDTTDTGMCLGEPIDNPGCGGNQPYCINGDCVGCGDFSCPDIEPDKPACAENLGRCVECVQNSDCATAEKPACNAETATCEPCTMHEQCEDSACNLETGECFPTDNILYVNSPTDGNPCSDANPAPWGLTPEEPICFLSAAISRLAPGKPTMIKIKGGNGSNPQNKPAGIPDGNYIVAIGYYGMAVPSLIPNGNVPALTVGENNTVFMNRVGVYNTTPASDPLILCDGNVNGARLWLERQRIFTGKTAIKATNCRVHVRRSVITGHTTGGIDMTGETMLSQLWLENTYVTENTGLKAAIRLGGGTVAKIVYSTIGLNNSAAPTIDCIANWNGSLEIRNSVIVGKAPHYSLGCGDVKPVLGRDSNETSKGQLGSVFAGFSDGVFQAITGGDLLDTAKWLEGDPRVDQDGTPRPAVMDALDYAGADRPEL